MRRQQHRALSCDSAACWNSCTLQTACFTTSLDGWAALLCQQCCSANLSTLRLISTNEAIWGLTNPQDWLRRWRTSRKPCCLWVWDRNSSHTLIAVGNILCMRCLAASSCARKLLISLGPSGRVCRLQQQVLNCIRSKTQHQLPQCPPSEG